MDKIWNNLLARYTLVQTRERWLLAIMALVLPLLIGDVLIFQPLFDRHTIALKELASLERAASDAQAHLTELRTGQLSKTNLDLIKHKDRLEAEHQAQATRIGAAVGGMIPPQQMVKALESVLRSRDDLRLVAIENLPAVPYQVQSSTPSTSSDAAAKKTPSTSTPLLYEHKFIITFDGNYLATLEYFIHLTTLQWKFHWESLDYKVTDYPTARIVLTVKTLSLSPEWIGV